jgi:hypothetical protein
MWSKARARRHGFTSHRPGPATKEQSVNPSAEELAIHASV